MRPHCNFCHLLKSAKFMYCFHHFVTHSTSWQGPTLSPTWQAVVSFMEGWRTCPIVSSLLRWNILWNLAKASGKPEKREGGELHFSSLYKSYLWYSFLMSSMAILEEKRLFVPLWKFSKPQDNGFKERNEEWWNNKNAITLSRRKTTAHFNWVV